MLKLFLESKDMDTEAIEKRVAEDAYEVMKRAIEHERFDVLVVVD
jgi:hypothetical protein